MTHHFPVRVYYEDTDMAGIVYYANYFKFIERGRSEFVRDLGIDQGEMKEAGLVFAVRKLTAEFRKPARFDDVLDVRTMPVMAGGARFELHQEVWRDTDLLFEADVIIAVVGANGQPARIPANIRRLLGPSAPK